MCSRIARGVVSAARTTTCGAKDVSSTVQRSQNSALPPAGLSTNLGGSSVQGLGGLVGTLLQLTVVAGRLDQVQDFLCVCQHLS